VGGIFAGVLVLLGCTQALLDKQAPQGELVNAPAFEVDPLWPKPLPNHWLLGMTIGVWVDEQDHVWIIHRSSATLNANERGAEVDPPTGECCRGAPPVLVFDQAGNLVRHWGGPGQGYEWPQSNHGIFVDYKGNVWIGGNGEKDAHILKFTKDGKFLLQVGRFGNNKGSNDLENFGRVAKIFVDAKTNEAFVADGYGNRRVAVLDADTGKMKRYWGAYGNRPQDGPLAPFNPDAPPSQQFRNPVHCSDVSNDGFVYVCDRQANRLQVFTKDGKFVKEQWYARRSLSEARCGTSRSRATRSSATSSWPTAATRRCASSCARRWRRSPTSATAAASRDSSSASTASPRIRKATSTPQRRTRESGCRNLSTRECGRCGGLKA